jgi:hypothetical protein
MKIRQGFVSNSSSSSFLMWGAVINGEVDDINDKEYEYRKKTNVSLSVYCPYDDETIYIGRELMLMKDDETLRQFKDDTEKAVKECLNESKLGFGFQEESWYNG